ncbi:hypothetical protein [Paraburkholderia fungorum]|uniref:hypothetical protein n=1 Tax=Paraburkholderia fungorum TaxID=134537 RepID=UPI0004AB301F|nr:hypothetical protein [Paraburkholderia fungorum]KFX62378.1 hypothetical protein KBK24_0128420 [Burkholderia sp. K24]USX08873.1 hypothetical protein NHH62_19410 [Paraburkholderia fungorum]
MAISRRQRLRRVGIVCCHALRNLAYYRTWFDTGKPRADEQFWVTANGNFAEVTVLEWCKVLADERGKHHWTKVVKDQTAFLAGLLDKLGIEESAWLDYIGEMRFLRDKFIAHLDDENEMTLPLLDIAKASTIYLYTYLLTNENEEEDTFADAPQDAVDWFDKFAGEAKVIYVA